jgi:hypothetical protein
MTTFTPSERELAQWLHEEMRKNHKWCYEYGKHYDESWLLTARELQKKMVDKEELESVYKMCDDHRPFEIQEAISKILKSHFLKDGLCHGREASVATEDESKQTLSAQALNSASVASIDKIWTHNASDKKKREECPYCKKGELHQHIVVVDKGICDYLLGHDDFNDVKIPEEDSASVAIPSRASEKSGGTDGSRPKSPHSNYTKVKE